MKTLFIFRIPSNVFRVPTLFVPNTMCLEKLIHGIMCRMWDFAVGLFMIEIWKHSLFLASLYGLVETATVVVFGVTIGDWMDKFARLKVKTN